MPEKTKPESHFKHMKEKWGPSMGESSKSWVSRGSSWRALAAYSVGQEEWIVTVPVLGSL